MRLYKVSLLTGLLGLLLASLASEAITAERERGSCRRGDRLRIQDLDISPDPIVEGQRVRLWKARIRLEGNRECDAEIEIRDGDDVFARQRVHLRPGINEINVRPDERYRFHKKEHCVKVVVDLEGTRREVDTDRRFCARQKTIWSMAERDDQEQRQR